MHLFRLIPNKEVCSSEVLERFANYRPEELLLRLYMSQEAAKFKMSPWQDWLPSRSHFVVVEERCRGELFSVYGELRSRIECNASERYVNLFSSEHPEGTPESNVEERGERIDVSQIFMPIDSQTFEAAKEKGWPPFVEIFQP